MKSSASFEIHEYGNGSANEIVALVPGLGGSHKDLDIAAENFVDRNKDVVLYEHHPGVLLDGNPYELPRLINTISDDFIKRSLGHDAIRVCGVSLGGAIGASMQVRLAEARSHEGLKKPERGFYASTGGNLAEIVHDNQWFRSLVLAMHHVDIQKAYHNYDTEGLAGVWESIQHAPATPATPLTLRIGKLDRIVRNHEVADNIAIWSTTNNMIDVKEAHLGTHGSMIRAFNHKVVDLALGIHSPGQSVVQQQATLPARRLVLA